MKNFILTETYINEKNEKKVSSKTFSDCEQASYEMYYQIKNDLSKLSDYSDDMDFIEQLSFLNKLMLGNVEELNGYDINYVHETCTYTRKKHDGVDSFELCINNIDIDKV